MGGFSWSVAADVLAAVFLLCGAFLTLAAGVGVVRFPDLLARMHAATKPQVLGLMFVLIAVGLRIRSWQVVGMLLLVVVFQLLTSPVAAHMVGRAGYRTGKVRTELLDVDEATSDQKAAERESGEIAEDFGSIEAERLAAADGPRAAEGPHAAEGPTENGPLDRPTV